MSDKTGDKQANKLCLTLINIECIHNAKMLKDNHEQK